MRGLFHIDIKKEVGAGISTPILKSTSRKREEEGRKKREREEGEMKMIKKRKEMIEKRIEKIEREMREQKEKIDNRLKKKREEERGEERGEEERGEGEEKLDLWGGGGKIIKKINTKKNMKKIFINHSITEIKN